jgi:hypothetical protein
MPGFLFRDLVLTFRESQQIGYPESLGSACNFHAGVASRLQLLSVDSDKFRHSKNTPSERLCRLAIQTARVGVNSKLN